MKDARARKLAARNRPGVHYLTPLASQVYVGTALSGPATSTISQTAGTDEYFPFFPANDLTIDQLAAEITTGAAGSTLYIAVYADVNGAPDGGALLGSVGPLAGDNIAFLTSALSLTLLAGSKYWLMICSSSSSLVYRSAPGSVLYSMGYSAGPNAASINKRTAARAFAAPPATAPATIAAAGGGPLVLLRKA